MVIKMFNKLRDFYTSKRGKSICFFAFYLVFFLVLAIILRNRNNVVSNEPKNENKNIEINENNHNSYNLEKIVNSNYEYFYTINDNEEIKVANYYKDSINIKAPSIEQKVGNLSGGNQQKVQLAKWMFVHPKVLILDEPTRGIDVGAKFEIYTLMNKLVEQGMSIIMISSELPEVLGMSDRLYVMSEGTITGELSREEATEEKVMALAIKSKED